MWFVPNGKHVAVCLQSCLLSREFAVFYRLTKRGKAASNKIAYFAMFMVIRRLTFGIIYGKQDTLNRTQSQMDIGDSNSLKKRRPLWRKTPRRNFGKKSNCMKPF